MEKCSSLYCKTFHSFHSTRLIAKINHEVVGLVQSIFTLVQFNQIIFNYTLLKRAIRGGYTYGKEMKK